MIGSSFSVEYCNIRSGDLISLEGQLFSSLYAVDIGKFSLLKMLQVIFVE